MHNSNEIKIGKFAHLMVHARSNISTAQVYSAAGRRLLPMLRLGAPVVHMASDGDWRLLVVAADGELKVLDVQAGRCDLKTSVMPLLGGGRQPRALWLSGVLAAHATGMH